MSYECKVSQSAPAASVAPAAPVKVKVPEETARLIKLLKKGTISSHRESYANAVFSHGFDTTEVPSGRIKPTPARRLIQIAELFFDQKAQADGKPKGIEEYEYFGTIPGVDIIDKSHDDINKQCVDFVFGEKEWFKTLKKSTLQLRGCLFDKATSEFLAKQGFKKIEKPEVGAVIMYSAFGTPTHFGKVVQITETGDVIVESKWWTAYTYRHKFDLIECNNGNEYAYFKESGKT